MSQHATGGACRVPQQSCPPLGRCCAGSVRCSQLVYKGPWLLNLMGIKFGCQFGCKVPLLQNCKKLRDSRTLCKQIVVSYHEPTTKVVRAGAEQPPKEVRLRADKDSRPQRPTRSLFIPITLELLSWRGRWLWQWSSGGGAVEVVTAIKVELPFKPYTIRPGRSIT